MEDVLDVFKRPYDSKRPQLCMDELMKQLIAETRTPFPVRPGRPALYDHEYKRNGTANIFMAVEPLLGRCEVKVTQRRTKIDWAYFMKDLVDIHYPDAETIVLVLDNLNTHVRASLYEAFEPKEAKRIADKLEIHYTPKHGSWLNMAEIALSILGRQCLNRRIEDFDELTRETRAWEEMHNQRPAPINWRFTTQDARIKLRKLYPTMLM